MSIEKLSSGHYRVRYAVGGRGSGRRSATFERKRDADLFEANWKRHKAFGDLALLDAGTQPVAKLASEWFERYAVPNLADHTLDAYTQMLDKHVIPRVGTLRVRDVKPNVVRELRAKLERAGVGRDSVRKSLVVLQAMFRYAEGSDEWGVVRNPVRAVEKPSARRERAIVCLAPRQIEALRSELLARGKLWAATLVSVIGYAGLRARPRSCSLSSGATSGARRSSSSSTTKTAESSSARRSGAARRGRSTWWRRCART